MQAHHRLQAGFALPTNRTGNPTGAAEREPPMDGKLGILVLLAILLGLVVFTKVICFHMRTYNDDQTIGTVESNDEDGELQDLGGDDLEKEAHETNRTNTDNTEEDGDSTSSMCLDEHNRVLGSVVSD